MSIPTSRLRAIVKESTPDPEVNLRVSANLGKMEEHCNDLTGFQKEEKTEKQLRIAIISIDHFPVPCVAIGKHYRVGYISLTNASPQLCIKKEPRWGGGTCLLMIMFPTPGKVTENYRDRCLLHE